MYVEEQLHYQYVAMLVVITCYSLWKVVLIIMFTELKYIIFYVLPLFICKMRFLMN